MIVSDLVVGSVYFLPTYDDSGMTRPIILSFEYKGAFIQDAPKDSNPFHFNFLAPYAYADDAETQLHFFSESDVADLVDIHGLLREIEAVRGRLRA